MKRENNLSWDEYFMSLAIITSMRSKDNDTQVGSCIVNSNNKIISLGYNGMPNRCSDDELPWEREGDPLNTKYLYVVHAELNAILNSTLSSLDGCKLFTTLFPCNECCKAIIQSGIGEVVYLSDKYSETESVIASKKMFEISEVKIRPYSITNKIISYVI